MDRNMSRIIIIVVLILFGALTAVALVTDGVFGIFASIFNSFGSAQIYVDLVIAISMICVWMWRDAKSQGRNPWPWIIAALIVGAFSPLVYLLVRDDQ